MKIPKKILFLILLAIISVPSICWAAQPASLAPRTLQQIVDHFANQLLLLGVGLSTIAFMVAGIMFLTAAGSPQRMGVARLSLLAAVIGIIVMLLAKGSAVFVKTMFGI